MPKVLNKKKVGLPEGSMYVGRPSVFGNPYIIGQDGTREEVIEKYRQWIAVRPQLIEYGKKYYKGCDLVCWCSPLPCHADILLKLFND